MGARRRLARLQTRQLARERFADADESALHQVGGWRKIVKAWRNHRARKIARGGVA